MAGVDESGFVGDDDELGAVSGGKLYEQMTHVGLGGGVAHEELLSKFGVGLPFRYAHQHLALASGELVQSRISVLGEWSSDKVLYESSGDTGGKQRVPSGDEHTCEGRRYR